MKLVDNKNRNFFYKILLFIYFVIIFYKQKANIISFYNKIIIKIIFYPNYFFNIKLILQYVIINIIIKAKREENNMRKEIREKV